MKGWALGDSVPVLVTPVPQQQLGDFPVWDCSKIILSVTGMEVSSLDPCSSWFWPSQHSLAGSSAGRSPYFCLLSLFVLESWKQSMMCVVWSLSLSLGPHQHDLSEHWAFLPAWSSGSGCSVLPGVGACLPLSPCSYHPPHCLQLFWKEFSVGHSIKCFFANPRRLDLIHYPCLRSDSSW